MFHVSFSGLIWKRSTSQTSGLRPRHQVVKMRMPGACFQSSWCLKRTPLDHGKLGQTLGPESDKYPNMNRNIEMTNWLCLGYDGWHVDFGATDFFPNIRRNRPQTQWPVRWRLNQSHTVLPALTLQHFWHYKESVPSEYHPENNPRIAWWEGFQDLPLFQGKHHGLL